MRDSEATTAGAIAQSEGYGCPKCGAEQFVCRSRYDSHGVLVESRLCLRRQLDQAEHRILHLTTRLREAEREFESLAQDEDEAVQESREWEVKCVEAQSNVATLRRALEHTLPYAQSWLEQDSMDDDSTHPVLNMAQEALEATSDPLDGDAE